MKAFHQSAHIRALANMVDGKVYWVVQEVLSQERCNLGWFDPDSGKAEVIVNPDEKLVNHLIRSSSNDTVHIFSGTSSFPLVRCAFNQVRSPESTIGLLVENRDDQGVRGLERLMRYRFNHMRFGNRIHFILCMGYTGEHGGRNWYAKCGYSEKIIFPYGYFPETPSDDAIHLDINRNEYKIVYIGQLIQRKRIDLLLKALSHIGHLNWSLDIIGSGPLREPLIKLSTGLGIADKVHFQPAMSNIDAMKVLDSSDLLVLPSRFDGWGVVINEALLRGVPVVCSDRCGGQDLLLEKWRGETFRSGSMEDLSSVLRRKISEGPPAKDLRDKIRNWTIRNASGERAAKYFLRMSQR